MPTKQSRSERRGCLPLLICNFHFSLCVISVFHDLCLCGSDDLERFAFVLAYICFSAVLLPAVQLGRFTNHSVLLLYAPQ